MAQSRNIDRVGLIRSSKNSSAAPAAVRFETLDSWRGICALLVAMMHFPASGMIGESPFVRGAYLFVDYFFVLSGFVIAHGYGAKINHGSDFARFAILRFGRIYPLHVAVLLLFLGYELMRLAVPVLRGQGAEPFSAGNTLAELTSSLFLLNGIGVDDRLAWNGPSWSISAEFWTYLLFGAAVLMFRGRAWLALLPAVVVGPVILYYRSPDFMDATWDLGFVRCLYGFALGTLLHRLVTAWGIGASGRRTRQPGEQATWTIVELGAVAAVVAFVVLAADNAASIAAPFVFALALCAFVLERGLVSRLLKTPAFLWLGALSYGIYMVHIFVQGRMINVASVMEKVTGLDLVGDFVMHGQAYYGFGVAGGLFGTAMLALMVVLVVVAALIVHVLVERPFQRLSKRLAAGARMGPVASPRSLQPLAGGAGTPRF